MPVPVIDIIVPTLGRPHRIGPLARNVAEVTEGRFTLTFVLDWDDADSLDAWRDVAGLAYYEQCDGTYPRKINHGVAHTSGWAVCLSGDDAVWHRGWDTAAVDAFERGVQVVGTRDLTPASENGDHSTQPIARRRYIDEHGGAWREPGRALHEGYHHNFCETELCQLAMHRGVWVFAPDSVIEHRHPDWGTNEMDATYKKGAKQHWDRDAALFEQRRQQWSKS